MRHLSLALVLMLLAGCTNSGPFQSRPIPKDALLYPYKSPDGRQAKVFWMLGGARDAPELSLHYADTGGAFYEDRASDDLPLNTPLLIDCDPWADALRIVVPALYAGMMYVGPRGEDLAFRVGEAQFEGPVRTRNFGATDIAIPGGYFPVSDGSLTAFATAPSIAATWSPKSVTFPAPPLSMRTEFVNRCRESLRAGAPVSEIQSPAK